MGNILESFNEGLQTPLPKKISIVNLFVIKMFNNINSLRRHRYF